MADGGHANGVRGESESERTPKGTAGKGAKESSYTPLYSAIPRLQKRSIKCCVPRICQLRVSRIEALAPLTDKSESNVRLVVDVSDGRSRFRETARTMKVRRAALSSQPVQITPMENVEWPVNQLFYLQYFHNLRKNSDNVRILLKKERSKRLGKNTVAECTVNLANVLQCPIEDGQVIDMSRKHKTRNHLQSSQVLSLKPDLNTKFLEQQPTHFVACSSQGADMLAISCTAAGMPRPTPNFNPLTWTMADTGDSLLQAKQERAGKCSPGEDALLAGKPPDGPRRCSQVVARGG